MIYSILIGLCLQELINNRNFHLTGTAGGGPADMVKRGLAGSLSTVFWRRGVPLAGSPFCVSWGPLRDSHVSHGYKSADTRASGAPAETVLHLNRRSLGKVRAALSRSLGERRSIGINGCGGVGRGVRESTHGQAGVSEDRPPQRSRGPPHQRPRNR